MIGSLCVTSVLYSHATFSCYALLLEAETTSYLIFSHGRNTDTRKLDWYLVDCPQQRFSSDFALNIISDNEGNILAAGPGESPGDSNSDPGPSDNRLLDPDSTPAGLFFPEQRKSPRCISRGCAHPFNFEPPLDEKLFGTGGRPTVQIGGCIISRAFLKERPSERLVGSLIGRALLINADALCAAATPMMNNLLDV